MTEEQIAALDNILANLTKEVRIGASKEPESIQPSGATGEPVRTGQYAQDKAARFELAKLWTAMQDQEGLSSSIIAIRYKVSRNTVCGAIHRVREKLGKRRPSSSYHHPEAQKSHRETPSLASTGPSAPLKAQSRPRKAKAAVAPPQPVGGAFHICDLKERQCRFPTKTTKLTHLFCGAPCDLESSWCPDHRLVVFQPIVNRPKQAQDA